MNIYKYIHLNTLISKLIICFSDNKLFFSNSLILINNLTHLPTKKISSFFTRGVLFLNPQTLQQGFLRLSKNTLVMYLIVCFAFSGITGLFLFNPFGTKQADAAWFNDSWGYRKEVPITAHSADETDKYIAVTLADTDDLVTNGQLQSDCGDMRFTKQNGDILPYYIASGCNSSSTVVHIYFDSFPAGAQTIYFYYNNPLVSDGFEPADFSTEASSYTVGTIGSTENAPFALFLLEI